MESKITYIITKMNNMDEKLDKVLEHNKNTDVTLAIQAEQLKYHILRTDLLQKELEPLKEHTNMVRAIIKVVTVLFGSAGIIYSIYKFFVV